MTLSSAGLQAIAAGPPGKSAYQVALDNGFVGTAAQWIASLQGAPGSTGAPGAPGAAGPMVSSVPVSVSTATATIPAGTTYVGVTSIPGGGCSITLPLAGAYAKGASLHIGDESGSCSATLPITIGRAVSDTISGLTAEVLQSPYQVVKLTSNGSNLWMIS